MNALRSISKGNFMNCLLGRRYAGPLSESMKMYHPHQPHMPDIASYYHEVYQRSLKDPAEFWAQAAEAISWVRKWDRVFDVSRQPFVRWFPGGVLNTCYNAVDRHIERGRGKQRALIYDSPVTNTIETFTYIELRDRVAQLAGALRALGVGKEIGRAHV